MDVNNLSAKELDLIKKYTNKLGAKPSPKDERNYNISKLTAALDTIPEEYPWNTTGFPVRNQGEVGSCVSETLGCIKYFIEKDQTNNAEPFSIAYMYGNRSETDYQGAGMIPLEAIKHLHKEGAVLYKDFPYHLEVPEVIEKVKAQNTQLLPKAYPFRISAYAELKSATDIKTAIIKLKAPVLIVIPVWIGFLAAAESGLAIAPHPDLPEDYFYGYHAMPVGGWTKEGWIALNSWGEEWGDNGKVIIPFDYVIAEAWSITDTIVPEPKQDPKEVYDMKKVVLYMGDADIFSAVLVSQKNQCPLMKKADFELAKLKAEKIIQIGGKPGSTRYTSLIDAAELVK